MDGLYNKHYIRTDKDGYIIEGWSDGPYHYRDTADAICINNQGGYQFRLVPGGEENPVLSNEYGIPFYKWDGVTVQQRTETEMQEIIQALPEPAPSDAERLHMLENVVLTMMLGGMTNV